MRQLYIGFFGMLGVFARYYMGLGVSRALPTNFPYGTFAINVIGALLIGVVYVLGVEKLAISDDLRIGIAVGFLGGFTTFSSYCLELNTLVRDERALAALLYAFLSTVLGFSATWLGMALTRRLA